MQKNHPPLFPSLAPAAKQPPSLALALKLQPACSTAGLTHQASPSDLHPECHVSISNLHPLICTQCAVSHPLICTQLAAVHGSAICAVLQLLALALPPADEYG